MTVALLGPVYPYRGGIAHYTARLAQALHDTGHAPLVVNLTRQYPAALFPGSTQEDTSRQAFETPSVRWVDSMRPDTWISTAARLRRQGVTTLAVQWWHPYFAPSFGSIARLCRRAGLDVVFVCHNVEPHERSPADRLLLRWAYGGASRFVVHARAERERMEHYARGRRVDVVPHPTYDLFATGPQPTRQQAREALGLHGDDEVALFFGLIRPYKGLPVLLEALAHGRERRRIRLVIAGECYGDASEVTAQIERLGLTDRVTAHLHYIANEEVGRYMQAADVVVAPYLHATQSGIVQVAYAFGVPVITTRVGGIPEVVWQGETGLLVEPGDRDGLANALVRFFAEGLGPDMRRGVERRRLELTWERLARVVAGEPT